jgi:hypothetical protein
VRGNKASRLEPVASFVIEREAGRGYRVTAADGDCPEARSIRALKLLDDLGQPDPRGPNELFRWLGPIAPSGEYIAVSIKLMPNGEARYHQGWFRLRTPAHGGRLLVSAFLLVLVVALVIGTLAGRMRFAPERSALPDSARTSSTDGPASTAQEPGLRPSGPVDDPGLEKLNTRLSSSRDVRDKIKKYLSQEGLAARSEPVSVMKRSVKLIADLDKPPPPVEVIRLDNGEVAKLLELLRTLDDLHELATSTGGKPDEQ